MKPEREALRMLAVRTLEYVGIKPDPEVGHLLDGDAEMRSLALAGLKLLGLDAAHELRRHLRKKKVGKNQ